MNKDKIIYELNKIVDYFKYHNKNLTKEQYYQIQNIEEIIKELDNLDVYFEVCKNEITSAIEDIYNDELYSEYEEDLTSLSNEDINDLSLKLYNYAEFDDIYESARGEIFEKIIKESEED